LISRESLVASGARLFNGTTRDCGGGKLAANHSRSFKVKTGLKGGRLAGNHSRTLL